jgi:hypothetical protein
MGSRSLTPFARRISCRIAPIKVHARDIQQGDTQQASIAIRQHLGYGVGIALDLASPSQSHRPQNRSQIKCRKSRCRGDTGLFDGLGGQRLIRHILSLPTVRNLPGVPPSVNHLGGPEYANGVHYRLPGLGTFGAPKADFKCRLECGEATIVRILKTMASAESLLFRPA